MAVDILDRYLVWKIVKNHHIPLALDDWLHLHGDLGQRWRGGTSGALEPPSWSSWNIDHLNIKTRKHVRCKPHVCPHRIPHIAYPQGNAQIPAYGLAFFTFQYLKTQKPKPLIKTLNPKKPQVKIAAYSQCFHSSSGDSLWYCLGMFFGLWRTWGLAPTCLMAMYLFGIGVFPNFGLLNTQYSSNEWRC